MHSRSVLTASATTVAPALLGASLVSDLDGATVAVRVTEVEAYEGERDAASHAFRGPTPRNAVMFGPPGFLYVYFVYGMHWCANVVCGPEGTASALLVRAGQVTDGVDVARDRRRSTAPPADLARGPARLARCLGLTGAQSGVDLLSPASPVRLTLPAPLMTADRAEPAPVATGPRVGVASARVEPLRFWLAGDPTVSAYRPASTRRRRPTGQTGPRAR